MLEGAIVFAIETTPPVSVHVHAGHQQPIPPGIPHLVQIDQPVRLAVDFLIKPRPPRR